MSDDISGKAAFPLCLYDVGKKIKKRSSITGYKGLSTERKRADEISRPGPDDRKGSILSECRNGDQGEGNVEPDESKGRGEHECDEPRQIRTIPFCQ